MVSSNMEERLCLKVLSGCRVLGGVSSVRGEWPYLLTVQIPEGLAEDRQHWQGVAEDSDRKGYFISTWKFAVVVAEGDV